MVPSALLHSLKHDRVLHENIVLLTVETLRMPMAMADERVTLALMVDRFSRLTLRFGFMETPNVSRGLAFARRAGLKFDGMASSFFLGRRRPVVTGRFGVGQLMDRLFARLTRLAAGPSDYFHLPRDRVVELGYRVAVQGKRPRPANRTGQWPCVCGRQGRRSIGLWGQCGRVLSASISARICWRRMSMGIRLPSRLKCQ